MNHTDKLAIEVSSIPREYDSILREVIHKGDTVESRGKSTLEVQDVTIVSADPTDRIIPGTDWETLAVELASLRTGRDPATDPSEETQEQLDLLSSFYGQHMRKQFRYWTKFRDLLIEDPGTRKPCFVFWDTDDPSCTTRLQFMIRDNKLQCYLYERSNDAHWAFKIDTAIFQTLQDEMAQEVGVEVGKYHHHATSFHVYEDDLDEIKTEIDNYEPPRN